MTDIDEKPDTPQNLVLKHYGVQGMKWGVRKKKSTADEIHAARRRQDARFRGILAEDDKVITSKSGKQSDAAAKRRAQKIKDFETNEDRVTAARATRGEKIAAVVLTGGLGIVLLPAQKVYEKSVAKSTDKARERHSRGSVSKERAPVRD